MTLTIANHGTSTYTQDFVEWMQQKITCKDEELTHGLGHVLQIHFLKQLIHKLFTVWAQDKAGYELQLD